MPVWLQSMSVRSRAQGRPLVVQGGMDPAQGLHAGVLFAPGGTGMRKSKAKQKKREKKNPSTHLFLQKGGANPISINRLSRTSSLSPSSIFCFGHKQQGTGLPELPRWGQEGGATGPPACSRVGSGASSKVALQGQHSAPSNGLL